MAFGHDSRSSLVRIRDDVELGQSCGASYIHKGLATPVKNHSRRVKMYKPNTPWAWAFMLTTTIQALNVLAIESYVFVKFQTSSQIKTKFHDNRSIPTFLTLFIFGFLYQLLLVYDSLRLKNTIQVIGLCIYNLGMLIYATIQFDQMRTALREVSNTKPNAIDPDHPIWRDIRPFLMVVPCIIATFTLLMSLIAWKLYDEFAWTIYKHISADLKMRRRFLTFQIYISLLKFDFFFFLGFTVQFVVIVSELTSTETALTIAAIPVTILILTMAGFWTRRENKVGMLLTIFLYFCGLAYFIFKLARMYQPGHMEKYLPARKSLTSFAVLTIILIILTIMNASICTANFGMGLKPHLMKRKIGGEGSAEKDIMTELPEFPRGPVSSRMTID